MSKPKVAFIGTGSHFTELGCDYTSPDLCRIIGRLTEIAKRCDAPRSSGVSTAHVSGMQGKSACTDFPVRSFLQRELP